MSASAPPALPAMDNSIGAFMVGTILSIFLAGITSVQAFEYYDHFGRKDRKLIVGLVSFLLVCDLFHTAISCYTLWTVTNYMNPAALVKSPWSFTWDPFLCGVVAISVQLFYCYRIHVVSKRSWYLPVVIGVLAFLSCAFAIASTWKIYDLDSQFARFGEFRYGVAIWLIAAAVADVLITGSLIYYLRRASKGDYQRSASIVKRILTVTIETNGLTCMFAILDAVLFLTMPEQSWHVIPNLSLVKLYFNGLLVSLNCRRAFNQNPLSAQTADSYVPHGTPAPKYSPDISNGSGPSPDVITPATLGHAYGSPSNEKRGFFSRSGSRSGEARKEAIQVHTTQEVITRVSDNGDDLEKNLLDQQTAQAFELTSVKHSSNDLNAVHIVPTVPHIPHAYTATATGLTPPDTAQPSSTGQSMAGAIPREWA
ncbi:hypothetical protein JCM8547_004848 [Rhodosporidiobolus lusitaniae]